MYLDYFYNFYNHIYTHENPKFHPVKMCFEGLSSIWKKSRNGPFEQLKELELPHYHVVAIAIIIAHQKLQHYLGEDLYLSRANIITFKVHLPMGLNLLGGFFI